jgi:hypothetical protein
MASPSYSDVIGLINEFIITNGNNEITAAVLNPILEFMTDFANNNMGDLSLLTTDLTDDLVSAINSLKQNFDDLSNNGVQLYTGVPNPNVTPPATYNYADFYMQIDNIDSSPVQLWQWDGYNWVEASQFEVLANKRGSYTNDGTGQLYYNVDYINLAISNVSKVPKGTEYLATGGETSFSIGTTALASLMFYNGVPQAGSMWSQSGSTITLNFTNPLVSGDFMQFV